jgi:hypothetical protein
MQLKPRGTADPEKPTKPELPPDSEMQKTVDQAKATSGDAKTTLDEVGKMKDSGLLYKAPKQ